IVARRGSITPIWGEIVPEAVATIHDPARRLGLLGRLVVAGVWAPVPSRRASTAGRYRGDRCGGRRRARISLTLPAATRGLTLPSYVGRRHLVAGVGARRSDRWPPSCLPPTSGSWSR